jgi:hypothetical protein
MIQPAMAGGALQRLRTMSANLGHEYALTTYVTNMAVAEDTLRLFDRGRRKDAQSCSGCRGKNRLTDRPQ